MFNFDGYRTFLQNHLFVQCLITMARVREHNLNVMNRKIKWQTSTPRSTIFSRASRSNALLDAVDVEFKKYEESCGYDVIL